jgi:DNA-binding PadR family transcriptional regulator
MTSPVDAAVLALVIERPGHGYEIWQRYDERFGSLMPVLISRIYKILGRLADNGLVERLPGAEDGSVAQPKPKYAATPNGIRSHRTWIAEELQADPLRERVLQRILSTSAGDVTALLDVMSRYERVCIDESSALTAAPTRSTHSAYAIVEGLRQQLLYEEKRLILDAKSEWSAYARRQIRAAVSELRALEDE